MSFWKKLFSTKEIPPNRDCLPSPPASVPMPESLHKAIFNGELQTVAAILKENPNLIYARAENGPTPLTIATIGGDIAMVGLLLANKADINKTNSVDQTP